MAINTWDGAAGNTNWSDAGNWNTTDETDRVPTDDDDAIIPDTTSIQNCHLTTDVSCKSLEIKNGATFDMDGNNLTLKGKNANDRMIDLGSTITAATWDGTVSFIPDAASGTFRIHTGTNATQTLGAVVINKASTTMQLRTDFKCSSLTITAGTLDTYSTNNNALTVTDWTIVGDPSSGTAGILTCNASTLNLGIAHSAATPSLYIANGGTLNGGTGTHNIGNFQMISSTVTFSTGTTTLSTRNASSYGMWYRNGGTFTHSGGKVVFTDSGNDPRILMRNDTTFYAMEVDIGTRTLSTFTWGEEYTLTISGDQDLGGGEEIGLYIKSGTFDTDNNGTEELDLTVTKETRVGDTTGSADTAVLDGDAGNMSFGSVIIKSDGKYIATSATTLITSGAHSGTWGLQNGGTFDANGGTIKVTASQASVHLQGDTFNNITVAMGSSSNATKWRNNSAATVVIEGNLLLEEGKFLRDGSGDGLQVNGNVTTEMGTTFGALSDTGDNEFRGDLTISGGSTCILSQNTTTLKGDFDNSGSFLSNGGLVSMIASGGNITINGTGTGEPVFHDLSYEGSSDVRVANDITVEDTLNINGSRFLFGSTSGGGQTDAILTMGTTSTKGTLTVQSGKTFDFYIYSNSQTDKLQAASSLFPVDVTVNGTMNFSVTTSEPDTGKVQLADINYIGSLTFDNGDKVELTGDCEFDAVTVSGGATLDLNGQRVKFSGQVDVVGTLNMTNSLVYMGNRFGGSGGGTVTELGSTVVFENSGSLTNLGDSNGIDFNNCFINNSSGTMDFINDWDCSGFLKIGAGNFKAEDSNEGSNNINAQDLTIATGGTLTMESTTATCSGDFTTGGGLIGKTGMYNNAIYNAQFAHSSAQSWDTGASADGCIEGWFKADTFGYEVLARSYGPGKWMILMNTNDIEFYVTDNSNTNTTLTVTHGLTANQWFHIACVADGTSQLMYINGKLVGSRTKGAGLKAETNDWALGANPDTSSYMFDGHTHNFRVWKEKRTLAEIRDNMFKTAPTDSNSKLAANINFETGGSGGAITDAAGNGNGIMHKTGYVSTTDDAAWAGAGTFTYGTSTIDLTGTGDFVLTNGTNLKVYNLKMAAASKTTTLVQMGGSMNVYGTHTVGAGTYATDGTPSVTYQGAGTVSDGGAGFVSNYITYWSSTASVPAAKFRFFIADQASVNLGGDIVCEGPSGNLASAYFRGGAYITNTNNYQVTTPNWYFDAGTTMNIGSSIIILNSTTGVTTSSATSVLSAGPGATISGTAAGTTFKSQNNWKVVGTCENLNVTNEELRVTGKVINCTGDIIQQHPSIDANQQLDYDTADDRDVMIGRDLDKNTELVN